MKKLLKASIALLLTAAMLLLAGCDSLGDVISSIKGGESSASSMSSSSSASSPASKPEPSSSSEPASLAPPESSETPSSSEILSSSEAEPLTLSDCVGVMRSEDFVYTDSFGNKYDNHFRIPQFLLDLPGAKAANDEIYDDYIDVFFDAEYAMKQGSSFPCGKLEYEAYLNGDVVSVMIVSFYDGGNYYYSVYNLDLESGNLLDAHGLARKLGISYYELRDRLIAAMEADYNEHWYYPDMLEDADEQKARTFTDENIDSSLLYLGQDGELTAVYTAYMSVGADYHHTVITVP